MRAIPPRSRRRGGGLLPALPTHAAGACPVGRLRSRHSRRATATAGATRAGEPACHSGGRRRYGGDRRALPQPDPDRPGEFYDYFIVDTFKVRGGKLVEHWSSINKIAPPKHPGSPAGRRISSDTLEWAGEIMAFDQLLWKVFSRGHRGKFLRPRRQKQTGLRCATRGQLASDPDHREFEALRSLAPARHLPVPGRRRGQYELRSLLALENPLRRLPGNFPASTFGRRKAGANGVHLSPPSAQINQGSCQLQQQMPQREAGMPLANLVEEPAADRLIRNPRLCAAWTHSAK